ncbi:T-cell differentiation antigen CD6-like isoform X2 [Heptranchias perlo]|uniref:T-cell differentiation antigen CD6-like isoform X2 n=1 Tax=Heptranchias perlo TaxID=212740 RepID=UPI00355A50C1
MEPLPLILMAILMQTDAGLVNSRSVTGFPLNGTIDHPEPNLNSTNTKSSPEVTTSIPPPEVPVRLVNGTSDCSGQVELLHNDVWKPLCREFWDLNAADVICGQLGCGPSHSLSHKGSGANASSFWVNLMNCTGAERDWRDCPNTMLPTGMACDRNTAAGLTCTEHKELRLAGGGSRCAGRVEVLSRGAWGTVCDDSWGLSEAAVVCRQLGCGFALSAPNASGFGQGRGPIYLDELRCSGREAYLWHCPSEPWLKHDCGHKEDAGVVCSEHRQIRLTGRGDPCSGRVSVGHRGSWGSLCDTVWDLSLAHGICRHLGCGDASRLDGSFQIDGEHTWGDMCREGDPEIPACLRSLPRRACDQGRAAGVVCNASLPMTIASSNITTDWITTVPVVEIGAHLPSNIILLLIIGLLVALLVILTISFLINYYKIKQKMVMRIAHPDRNDSSISANEYRLISIAPAVNNVKPPAHNVPLAARQINGDSDSFGDDYEDYDSFAPNHGPNFSTFKYSVPKQSDRTIPGFMPLPEVKTSTDSKARRSELRYKISGDTASLSSQEAEARAVSSNGGRRPARPRSHRCKKYLPNQRSTESSSTSSCEWYENTTQIPAHQKHSQLLDLPPMNDLQSSASTLPVEEYENVQDCIQTLSEPAPSLPAPAPMASGSANQPMDESSESDYDDIETYFP